MIQCCIKPFNQIRLLHLFNIMKSNAFEYQQETVKYAFMLSFIFSLYVYSNTSVHFILKCVLVTLLSTVLLDKSCQKSAIKIFLFKAIYFTLLNKNVKYFC